MSNIKIEREDGEKRGRYVATADGIDGEAELIYTHVGPKRISADHTEVPDVFRGQGVGRLLATRMVDDARAEGVRIRAVCTFVDAERKKHPDWADVFEN